MPLLLSEICPSEVCQWEIHLSEKSCDHQFLFLLTVNNYDHEGLSNVSSLLGQKNQLHLIIIAKKLLKPSLAVAANSYFCTYLNPAFLI